MDLFEAHAQGLPLVVETAEGGARLAAEIFALKDGGLVYVDIGWPRATNHPFHVLAGQLVETVDGWKIGDAAIRIAFDGEPLYAEWQMWLKHKATGGKYFSREVCRAEVEASGILDSALA